MRSVDLITKKRDGEELTKQEIAYLIKNYTAGTLPDYQMAALTMAIFFQGMNSAECANLTMAMVESGKVLDLSAIKGRKVDKHSTGGVGDTTTLVLAPLVASVGVPVAKLSGRGLGHTGGTIDKLESIPGFHAQLTNQQFIDLVNQNGLAIMSQNEQLTPADKKLYSLRDVTGTVNSIPLIASSIMSKKIAAGADGIVLDVKIGNGAFMKERAQAEALAKNMVNIGHRVGRRTVAILSDMNQPLGFAIGNALEVKEAILTLQGKGPSDLMELCLTLGSHMVVLCGIVKDLQRARKLLEEAIYDGRALEKYKAFLTSQGGDGSVIDHLEKLPTASKQIQVPSLRSGFVKAIAAEQLGLAAMQLGAGRAIQEARIDLAVGIQLHKKVGDRVNAGEPVATIHVNEDRNLIQVKDKIYQSFTIRAEPVKPPLLILGTISNSSFHEE